jgi:hypothetical protein
MSWPTSVKVGAVEYSVAEVAGLRLDGAEMCGLCRVGPCQIEVKADMPAARARETLLHEVIHAVNSEYGIGLKERQVQALGTALVQVLRDNPALKED